MTDILATFGENKIATVECVKIQQDESRNSRCPAGYMTLFQIIAYKLGEISYEPPTEITSFQTVIVIQAPTQQDIENIELTYGEILSKKKFIKNYTESLNITPDDYPSFDLGSKTEWIPDGDSIRSMHWVGKVFDSSGNQTAEPIVSHAGNEVSISRPVYGSLSVTYSATIWEIEVLIKPRDASENNYTSSVLVTGACLDNGITEFQISIPICFQAYYDQYGSGGGTGETPGCSLINPGKLPESEGYDCEYKWEYCYPHYFISGTDDRYKEGDCYGGHCP